MHVDELITLVGSTLLLIGILWIGGIAVSFILNTLKKLEARQKEIKNGKN